MKKLLSDKEVWKKIARGDKDFRDVDLSGMDLAGIDLAWTNLFRANLTGANLTGSYLVGVNLNRAILAGVNLTGSVLTRAILIDSVLTGADFTNTNLTRASLEGAKLSADSGIITFQGIRYFAFFHKSKTYPYGHLLQIGCESYYDLDERIRRHTEISDHFKYSEKEREKMLEFIMSLELEEQK